MDDPARADPLAVQRALLLALLIALAAAAWAILLFAAQGPGAGSGTEMAMALPTMGLRAPLFLAIWVTMMVAMMFPAAAPMVLAFHRLQAERRRRGQAFVSTWVFLAGYMLVWTLSGAAAYAAALAAEVLAARAALPASAAARLGGGILVAAGLYQFTPLKALCLSQCRTPLSFLMTAWRDGTAGALRMGFAHGGWCLGCCWLLFAILFPLGMMNIAAMAAVTALIFAEKTLPGSRLLTGGSAVALLAYGAVVMAVPQALPTLPGSGMARAMPGEAPAPARAPARVMPSPPR